jgi:hypothetical protein
MGSVYHRIGHVFVVFPSGIPECVRRKRLAADTVFHNPRLHVVDYLCHQDKTEINLIGLVGGIAALVTWFI